MPPTPADLAARLRLIRLETHGEDGITELAEALGLPARTWRNFEDGVRMPSEVILRFLVLTGTEPLWLMTGEGDKYRSPSGVAAVARSDARRHEATPYAQQHSN